MKNDVILKKMSSLTRCLKRLEEKRPETWETLIEDYDLQDIISINLERSVQLSVDIGLQFLLQLNIQPPETMAEVFSLLGKKEILPSELAEHLKSAVGFRNIAVYEYEEIDWKIVYSILTHMASEHIPTPSIGSVLYDEFLEPLGITAYSLAKRLQVSIDLRNRKRAIGDDLQKIQPFRESA